MAGYTLIANAGSGSAIIEGLLELTGLPYAVEEVDYSVASPGRDRLRALNPLGQVPTLLLPDGSVMTESAAMTLHIVERVPAAGLAPAPDDPARPAFLRWLVFLVASLYPTFTYGDEPIRWVSGEEAGGELRDRTDEHRQELWRIVEREVAAPWFLGPRTSALDVYVSVMTRWRPRRDWFAAHCPRLHGIATAVDRHPGVAEAWRRNYGEAAAG